MHGRLCARTGCGHLVPYWLNGGGLRRFGFRSPAGLPQLWTHGRGVLLVALYAALSVGCGTVPERTPLPEVLSTTAQVLGIPKARVWGDESPPYADKWFAMSEAELKAQYPNIFGREHNYLAISGGGPNGAFAAGILLGWTEAGTRPEFTMVAGISTGALLAPFTFLGPSYDAQIKEIYTGISTKDIITERNLLAGLTSDALAGTEPLQRLIAKYITPQMMEAIAAETRVYTLKQPPKAFGKGLGKE